MEDPACRNCRCIVTVVASSSLRAALPVAVGPRRQRDDSWSSSASATRTTRWSRDPGLRVPDPAHRPAGQRRPARAVHRGAEPDDDHQGQRADQHRLPDLLADRRPAQERRERLRTSRAPFQGIATTTLRAVIGDYPPRRRALEARPDQRGPAHQARRGDRALGRQGHHGRDPRDHAAARRPGRDEPACSPPSGPGAPSSPSPRAPGRRPSTSPRARSSRRS